MVLSRFIEYIGSSIISPKRFAELAASMRRSFLLNLVLVLILSIMMSIIMSYPLITQLFIELGLGGLGVRFAGYIAIVLFITTFLAWLIAGILAYIGVKLWQGGGGSLSNTYTALTLLYTPQFLHGILSPIYFTIGFGAVTSILPITLGITSIWGIILSSIALARLSKITIGSSATIVIAAGIIASIISFLIVLGLFLALI